MELSLNRETVFINEVLYDGVLEQSIELDHILPDYQSSIFKILRCKAYPYVTLQKVINGKLLIEGVCKVEVLYTSEETFKICSVVQKQCFSKTVELKEPLKSGEVKASIRCDYLNCRAVSPRRLDIRGALIIKAVVTVQKPQEVLSGASGCGIQTRTIPLTLLSKKLFAQQEFSVREDIPLSYGKPPIVSVLSIDAYATLTESRIIANRAVVKGEVKVHLLYSPPDNASPEIMQHVFPISHVLDIQGITDDFTLNVRFDVTDIEPTVKNENADTETSLSASFTICAFCEAVKNAQVDVMHDAYSVLCEAEPAYLPTKAVKLIRPIKESRLARCSIAVPQNELKAVYDITCSFSPEETRIRDGRLILTGNLITCLLGSDGEDMPVSVEGRSPCEVEADISCGEDMLSISPDICIQNTSYRLVSAEEVEVTAELLISGFLCCSININALSDIMLKDTVYDRSDEPAIRLCYAQTGERIWDIAKYYRTDINSVIEENELEGDVLSMPCVLLIPSPSAVVEEK